MRHSRLTKASIIALLAATALGLTTPALAQNYRVDVYDSTDGLITNTLYDVTQDAAGYMWFATRHGLIVYDGLAWREINPGREISDLEFGELATDALGRVWSATLYSPFEVTLHGVDGGSAAVYEAPLRKVNAAIVSLAVSARRDSMDWIALSTMGHEVALWNGEIWRVLDEAAGLGTTHSLIFHEDHLLLASDSGLRQWLVGDADSQPEAVAGVPAGTIVAVCAASGGGLWIVSPDWIGMLDQDGFRTISVGPFPDLGLTSSGTTALEGPAGGLFFGNGTAVYSYHSETGVELLGKHNGLVSAGATGICLDREGSVWISTLRGVSKLMSRDLMSYTPRHGLYSDEVSSVIEMDSGVVVLGHYGGLTFLDTETHTLPLPPDAASARIMDMALAADGTLWLACASANVKSWNPEDGFRSYGPEHGLGEASFALVIDRSGQILVGGHGGLMRWNGDRFEFIRLMEPGTKPEIFVRRILIASDGSIYAATGRQGVFRIQDDEIEHFYVEGGVPPNNSYTLLERPDGGIWVGTVAGLYVPVDGTLRPVLAPDIDRPVYALTVDHEERVWIGTDRGILRWDGQRIDTIGVREGLRGNEVNRDALMVDRRGAVWIGTESGVNVYDSRFDLGPRAEPLLKVTSIEVAGQMWESMEELDFGVGAQDLDVHFTSSSYIDERGQRFRTWLEGFEEGWTPARPNPLRTVRYTNIPQGTYRFHVQAVGIDVAAGPMASSGSWTIRAPVRQRLWFRVVMIVFYAVVMWTVIAVIVGRRHAHRLELEVKDRTRDLERSERHLRVESERLSTILQSISDGVLTLDAAGVITLFNPACAAVTGLDVDRLLGTPLSDVLPEVAAWSESMSGRVGMTVVSLNVLDETNMDRWLEVASAPLADPLNESEGMVLAFRDVTDRRRAETEHVRAQKLESLGVLAGGIAHDFNNFLMVMMGNASLLEESRSLDDVERDCLAGIISAGRRSQALTQHLLTFARGGAPQRRPVSLMPVIREAIDLALSGTNVIGSIDLAADLNNVEADPSQIGQVLSNLFINARQAMVNGGNVRITGRNIDTAPKGVSGDSFVELVVADEGPGIPADRLEHVFEPYYTTKDGGTGLGLAISYSVIARHGGMLTVASTPGCGATFTIILPATNKPEMEGSRPDETSPPPCGRILVLDDEQHVRKVIDRILSRSGSEVVAVDKGGEAVQAFRTAIESGRPFDAVILDLTVPGGMGGLETFCEMKAIDPDVRGIVVSGYSDDEVMADPLAHGFAASLSKPFDRRALEDVLRVVLAPKSPVG